MKSILKSLYQHSSNEGIKKLIFDAFNISDHVRYFIAGNPNTPIYILEFLSNDKEWLVRIRVAENQSAPIHVLDKLSEDKNTNVRISVVNNPRTPDYVLDKLSKDKDLDVRFWIAKNKIQSG